MKFSAFFVGWGCAALAHSWFAFYTAAAPARGGIYDVEAPMTVSQKNLAARGLSAGMLMS